MAGEEATEEKPQQSSLRRRLRRGAVFTGVGLILVYAYMLVTAGGHTLYEALLQLDPILLILPLLATALSYITMSLSYEGICLLYTSPSPRDKRQSRMPSSA